VWTVPARRDRRQWSDSEWSDLTSHPVRAYAGSQPPWPPDHPGMHEQGQTGTNIRPVEPAPQTRKPRPGWFEMSWPLRAGLCVVIGGQILSLSSSSRKASLTWSATLAGVGGTIGGAVGLLVDIGGLGLSGGLGTLIGAATGASVGAALGKRIEGSPELLEKGDAFDFLYDQRRRYPKVSTPQLVEKALKQIPSYDKNDDGRSWYAKADLERFLDESPPAPSPYLSVVYRLLAETFTMTISR
jgi:hypothetical protein